MPQSAMDANAFAEIKALMGDTFPDVITLTLENLPGQMRLLEQAIQHKNAEQIFNTAHRIKSTSGSIGASGLAKKAEAIELIGRAGLAEVSPQLIDVLRLSITEVISVLEGELKN